MSQPDLPAEVFDLLDRLISTTQDAHVMMDVLSAATPSSLEDDTLPSYAEIVKARLSACLTDLHALLSLLHPRRSPAPPRNPAPHEEEP